MLEYLLGSCHSHFSLTEVTLIQFNGFLIVYKSANEICQAKIWSKMGTIDILTTPTQTVNKTCLNLPLCWGGFWVVAVRFGGVWMVSS